MAILTGKVFTESKDYEDLKGFDTVADMLASTTGYGENGYAEGDIIEAQGFRYQVVASDAETYHVENAADTAVRFLVLPNGVCDVRAFGSGTADDQSIIETAAAAASSNGVHLILDDAHNVGSTIDLDGDVTIRPRGQSVILTTDFSGDLFSSTAEIIDIEGVSVTGEHSFLSQTAAFTKIRLNNITFTGGDDTITSYLLETSGDMSCAYLEISDCDLEKCTPVFADSAGIGVARFERNTVAQPTRFIYRNLKQAGSTDSGDLFFYDNIVTDINGDLTDKSEAARMVQVELTGTAQVVGNTLDGATSTTASNAVYLKTGSLVFAKNKVKSISSVSSISVIDDKGETTDDSRSWIITDNVFDQSDISAANSPESIVRVNECRNVSVHDNTYIGLTCFAVRLYHSVDTGRYPTNHTVRNETVLKHDWPVVVQVFQNVTNVTISGIDVHQITNSESENISGETRCRIVDIYQSFDNGDDIEDVTIKGCTIHEAPSDAVILTIYRNAAATTSSITGVSVIGNELKSGAAFVRFKTSTMGGVDIANNIGPVGSSETIGTNSSGTRLNNNLTT